MEDLNVYGLYLKEMKKEVEYLSVKEEQKLVKEAKSGDKKARDKVITSSLHFVINVAKTFSVSKSLSREDLIGYGNIGLLKAFEKYDLSCGTRFITYASYWIYKEISDAVKKYSRFVRLPQNCEELLSKVNSIMDSFELNISENEKIEKTALILGISQSCVKNLLGISCAVISLDSGFENQNEDFSLSLIDNISDEKNVSPYEYTEKQEIKELISNMLENLPEDEKRVLVLRNGLDNKGCRSFRKIGLEMGVSNETVRKIERHALEHCRKYEKIPDFEGYFAA
ncbi:MAG: sigma-70 family RNA polymerase sigma factor [Treponema sp.]|nr:sigma-70 family RNA polymerase sigma factor [Treponema sp.]